MAPVVAGRLHVIAGPMFAGKTEELIRRVQRARLAGRSVAVISHSFDTRGGSSRLHTHTGASVPARMSADASMLVDALAEGIEQQGADLVAIDEAQFFGPELLELVGGVLDRGVDVEVAGLCVTYDAGPFEPLPSLMALAEQVTKLTAVCTVCGSDAPFHVRTSDEPAGDPRRPRIEHIGGAEAYQARCRTHVRGAAER